MVGDQMVQVTSAGVRLLAAQTGALHHEWLPPSGLQINIASASPSQASFQTTHPAFPVSPYHANLPCFILLLHASYMSRLAVSHAIE